MKQIHTIAQLFPALRARLQQIQLDLDTTDPKLMQKLQAAIDQGHFVQLNFAFGLAGVVDCQLLLVNRKTGETTDVSVAGAAHV